MKQGLLELAILLGLLVLAGAGALALEGEAIRAWLGLRPSPPAGASAARPAPPGREAPPAPAR